MRKVHSRFLRDPKLCDTSACTGSAGLSTDELSTCHDSLDASLSVPARQGTSAVRPSCTVNPSTGNGNNEQSVVIDAQHIEEKDFDFFNFHALDNGHGSAAGTEFFGDLSTHSNAPARRAIQAPMSGRIFSRRRASATTRSSFSPSRILLQNLVFHDGGSSQSQLTLSRNLDTPHPPFAEQIRHRSASAGTRTRKKFIFFEIFGIFFKK